MAHDVSTYHPLAEFQGNENWSSRIIHGGPDLSLILQDGTGAVERPLHDKIRETWSVKDFGVTGDGTTDDAANINLALAALAAAGGGVLYLPPGTYSVGTTISLPSLVTLQGAGKEATILKLKAAANTDVVKTTGYGATDARYFGIKDLTINGNWLASNWNAASNTINNTTGYGLKVQGYAFEIDVEIRNIPQVGAYFADLLASIPTSDDVYSQVSLNGRVFGEEGVIFLGPNDIYVKSLFIGLCGLHTRPTAETTRKTSTVYAGQPIDGIVMDGVNLEVGVIHVYACWAGRGIQTRNTVRLEAEHITTESNNGGIYLGTGTYGAISKLIVRNVSLLHPNWSAAALTYAQPNTTLDGVTLACSNFQIGECFVFRSITAVTRNVGTTALVVSGSKNRIGFAHRNSTAPAGDAEVGALYSGDGIYISGDYNTISAACDDVRGYACRITTAGAYNVISLTVSTPIGSGVYVEGNYNVINATVAGQTGSGYAFYNAGNLNVITGVSHSNSVPFGSAIAATNRVDTRVIDATTRTFTIATGVITVTTFDKEIVIDTEASAASDDLATISGGYVGQILICKSSNSGRDVTAKDAAGNLTLSADFTLSHPQDRLTLIFDGTNWCELGRSDNTA
jgi:hypothetical protein